MKSSNATFAQLVSLKMHVFILLPALLIFCCSPENQFIYSINAISTIMAKDNPYKIESKDLKQKDMLITDSHHWDHLKRQKDMVNKASDPYSKTDMDYSVYEIITAFEYIKSHRDHSNQFEMLWNPNDVLSNGMKSVTYGNATSTITQR